MSDHRAGWAFAGYGASILILLPLASAVGSTDFISATAQTAVQGSLLVLAFVLTVALDPSSRAHV